MDLSVTIMAEEDTLVEFLFKLLPVPRPTVVDRERLRPWINVMEGESRNAAKVFALRVLATAPLILDRPFLHLLTIARDGGVVFHPVNRFLLVRSVSGPERDADEAVFPVRELPLFPVDCGGMGEGSLTLLAGLH